MLSTLRRLSVRKQVLTLALSGPGSRKIQQLLENRSCWPPKVQKSNLEPIPEPSGTGSFCGVFGAKCACPPLGRRFWDRLLMKQASQGFRKIHLSLNVLPCTLKMFQFARRELRTRRVACGLLSACIRTLFTVTEVHSAEARFRGDGCNVAASERGVGCPKLARLSHAARLEVHCLIRKAIHEAATRLADVRGHGPPRRMVPNRTTGRSGAGCARLRRRPTPCRDYSHWRRFPVFACPPERFAHGQSAARRVGPNMVGRSRPSGAAAVWGAVLRHDMSLPKPNRASRTAVKTTCPESSISHCLDRSKAIAGNGMRTSGGGGNRTRVPQ